MMCPSEAFDPESWYSDEALRKQKLADGWPEGTPVPVSLLLGILEPRTQPQEHEKCVYCGSDARDGEGGVSTSKGYPFCFLCLGRGHDEDFEPVDEKGSPAVETSHTEHPSSTAPDKRGSS